MQRLCPPDFLWRRNCVENGQCVIERSGIIFHMVRVRMVCGPPDCCPWWSRSSGTAVLHLNFPYCRGYVVCIYIMYFMESCMRIWFLKLASSATLINTDVPSVAITRKKPITLSVRSCYLRSLHLTAFASSCRFMLHQPNGYLSYYTTSPRDGLGIKNQCPASSPGRVSTPSTKAVVLTAAARVWFQTHSPLLHVHTPFVSP